jgi:hypothetical protein
LIPDFFVDVGPRRLIVDAKHYGIAHLPATESITKQLLYRWFASRESGHGAFALEDLTSVFLLPAAGLGAEVVGIGHHELAGEVGGTAAFGRVWVVALDVEAVEDRYAEGRFAPEWAALVAFAASDKVNSKKETPAPGVVKSVDT